MKTLAILASILLLTALCVAGGPKPCNARHKAHGMVWRCQKPYAHGGKHMARYKNYVTFWDRK